jgi:hypothetical protein
MRYHTYIGILLIDDLLHIDEELMKSPLIQPMPSHTRSVELTAFDNSWRTTRIKQDFKQPSLGQAIDDNYQADIEHLRQGRRVAYTTPN